MATKSKAASKPAAKKAEPVEQASVTRDPESGELRLEVNGTTYSIAEQDLLNLRREINDVAAGFVH
jgi:hypothetical protein